MQLSPITCANKIFILPLFLFCCSCLNAQQITSGAIDSAQAYSVQPLETTNLKAESGIRHDTYMAFDSKNNSYSFEYSFPENYGKLFVRNAAGTDTRVVDLLESIKKIYDKVSIPKDTIYHAMGSITIDHQDRIYLIFYLYYPYGDVLKKYKARVPVLLYSDDLAESFQAFKIPGNPDLAFLEQKSPFETNNWPPLIGGVYSTGEKMSAMGDRNVYSLVVPSVAASGALSLSEAITLTEKSPGISIHTGGTSFASTWGSTSYITFNEIPNNKKGNKIVVLNFSRLNNTVTSRQEIPLDVPGKFNYPDPHATPVIVTTQNREQHVLVAPQAGNCYDFFRDISVSNTVPFRENAVLKGPRVYTSAVYDSHNNVYLFYTAYKPKPGLYFQKYDQSSGQWSEENLLAKPPVDFAKRSKDNYGIYYFKSYIDDNDALYLSFTFWDTYQKNPYPRFLFISRNGGVNWTLDK